MHLQDTVEAPEGEQQRVCAAHAEGDVHDSRRCQSTCRGRALSAFLLPTQSVSRSVTIPGRLGLHMTFPLSSALA